MPGRNIVNCRVVYHLSTDWNQGGRNVIFIILLIGLLAGCLGAIVGLGGGVIMLPGLQLLAGFDLTKAIGTTLFAVIFTSISGAQGHYRAGNVRLKSGGYAALGGLIGVLLGSYVFAKYLSNSFTILEISLGIFFLFTAYRMGRDTYLEFSGKRGTIAVDANKSQNESFAPLFALGFFTGCLTGMLGVGGGFIFTPGFMLIGGLSPQVAVGTTMLAMLPISLSGGLIKLYQGFVDLPAGIVLGLGTALGAQVGVWISSRMSPILLKVVFTILFAILAADYLMPYLLALNF
ncbi:MAG: hypothetical protein H6Q64_1855 [Firmicutes bacterium]|nr:hypothetical protein [Bacillota bacterium]